MRRAVCDDRREVGGGDAHGLGEGSDAFRSDIHGDVVSARGFHFPITLPMSRPTTTATVVLTRPGMRKEWVITYLPIRVVPERSKVIAAMIVPYVGIRKQPCTAGNMPISNPGQMPRER